MYVTKKMSPHYHQVTLEELLFKDDIAPSLITTNITNTRTTWVEEPSDELVRDARAPILISMLKNFNIMAEPTRQKDRASLYKTSYIPKKSGGKRRIDDPQDEIRTLLGYLRDIIEGSFRYGEYELYHTSAFAYVKGRCPKDATVRHQQNESKWKLATDLSNFFGSTTFEFTMRMLSMVYPFALVMKSPEGKVELEKAIEMAFLDGGLPQGSPLSPMLTNIVMIPIDHALANGLRDFHGQRFVYTRYADDFQITCKYHFKYSEVIDFINNTLKSFDAPFRIKPEKTKFGSTSGSNWMLGMVLNKDNQITIGYKNKRKFQCMLSAYIMDKKSGKQWEKHDVQIMDGHRAYYLSIEEEAINGIIDHLDKKFGVNVRRMIAEDLKK